MGDFKISRGFTAYWYSFFISAILFLNCNWKSLLGISVFILLGYYLFLGFVPIQDGVSPTFDRAPNNWANYIDLQVLGKHMWQPDYDPEGLLSTFPSIVSCLFGILIGKMLDGLKHVGLLFAVAVAFLLSGYVFNIWFPINKAIWSSSFVLVTTGWATLILAGVCYLLDIKKIQFGSIFKYVGMNAITLYFLSSFISKCMYLTKVSDNHNIHSYLYNNIFAQSFIPLKTASLLYGLTVVSFYILLAYVLFRKKVFIKV